MGVLSPQDVQGIMEMLESVQRAEAAGKLPPGSYERAMSEMQYESEYSGRGIGRSANEGYTGAIGNPDPVRAPWRGEYDMPGNFERSQHMANSMANDARLREELGYRRKRTEADDVEGTFAMSRYPGIEHAINTAGSGVDVRGGPMTPESVEERKRWAAKQREVLGMDRQIGIDELRGFRRGTRGLGAREKQRSFRQFLGG